MFSAKDKSTACGMWSQTYIIALVVTIFLIVVALFLSRKLKEKGVRNVLIVLAVFTISTEIVKMIFVGVTYGVQEVEFFPIYFCSLFMYSLVMALSKNEAIKNTGLAFLFFGGIVGATAFFIYPSSCIPNYPIYHFMCLRTMLFHGSMIYAGVLIVVTKFYTPKLEHFKNYLVFIVIASLLAYTINVRLGQNLMYLSKPLAFSISKAVFEAVPALYPVIVTIIQIFVPFFCSYFAFSLARLVKSKKQKKFIKGV